MKLLVETTGDFMLVDYGQGVDIESHRPSVVVSTSFVQSNIALGRLKVLGEVTDKATNADLLETIAGSKNLSVATEAFLAEFNPKPVTGKENAKRP